LRISCKDTTDSAIECNLARNLPGTVTLSYGIPGRAVELFATSDLDRKNRFGRVLDVYAANGGVSAVMVEDRLLELNHAAPPR